MQTKVIFTLLLCFIGSVTGCATTSKTAPHEKQLQQKTNVNANIVLNHASAFFQVYAERENFDNFMNFYAADAVLQDIVYGELVSGQSAIRGFYQWNAGNVELIGPKALYVTEQVVQDNTVVTRGYFTAFKFHGQNMGPWRFVIWQEFNAEGKIITQYDWINYTPKETFIGGENLNSLIRTQSDSEKK